SVAERDLAIARWSARLVGLGVELCSHLFHKSSNVRCGDNQSTWWRQVAGVRPRTEECDNDPAVATSLEGMWRHLVALMHTGRDQCWPTCFERDDRWLSTLCRQRRGDGEADEHAQQGLSIHPLYR